MEGWHPGVSPVRQVSRTVTWQSRRCGRRVRWCQSVESLVFRFADEVGALAVPVNELLRDYMGRQLLGGVTSARES